MEQECIGGSEHGLGKPGGLSGKVKARLKRGVVSVSVWCRKVFSEGRRTWEGTTFCQSMELLEDMGAWLHSVTRTRDLSYNEFSGPVRLTIGDLKHLLQLNLSKNHLTGSVPAEFGNLRSVQVIDISSNNFAGYLPEELGRLQILDSLT